MERQDIEVFLVLAEELHFARTAERLRLTPAAISQSVSKMERRFGTGTEPGHQHSGHDQDSAQPRP